MSSIVKTSNLPLLAGTLLAIGGALFAFVQVNPNLIAAGINLVPYEKVFLWIGGLLCVFGTLIFIWVCVIWIASHTTYRVEDFTMHRSNYCLHPIDKQEIGKVHKLCVEAFGDGVANQNRMAAWHKVNDRIYFLVNKEQIKGRKKTTEQIGYFDILPLNDHGIKEILNNKSLNDSIQNVHLCTPDEDPRAIYIGGIYAFRWLDKGVTLHRLVALLESYKLNNNVKLFYTRPITNDGLRLVLRRGFVPTLEQNQGINALYVLKLKDQI